MKNTPQAHNFPRLALLLSEIKSRKAGSWREMTLVVELDHLYADRQDRATGTVKAVWVRWRGEWFRPDDHFGITQTTELKQEASRLFQSRPDNLWYNDDYSSRMAITLPNLNDILYVGTPGELLTRRCCNTKVCRCVSYDGVVETPSQLDIYNEKLEVALAQEKCNLESYQVDQQMAAAKVRKSKARLESVDDFPKNSRFIVVTEDGTKVHVNLFKDADGVWHKEGRMVTWLDAYDVFTSENWYEPVDIIQVKPAKTIPGGKAFKGYGTPPAKKTATPRRRPAKKTVAKKTVAKK